VTNAAESSPAAGTAPPSAADLKSLVDMRVGVVKAGLQLTSDQEKYWPSIEDAIRARGKNRQERLQQWVQLRDHGTAALEGRNVLELMQGRADRLIQRGTDLKKLADAWQPLYKTLSEEQKNRVAFVSVVMLRGLHDVLEQRDDFEEDED
jgi:hypothetical protein